MSEDGWTARWRPNAVAHRVVGAATVDAIPVYLLACRTWVGVHETGAVTERPPVNRTCPDCRAWVSSITPDEHAPGGARP